MTAGCKRQFRNYHVQKRNSDSRYSKVARMLKQRGFLLLLLGCILAVATVFWGPGLQPATNKTAAISIAGKERIAVSDLSLLEELASDSEYVGNLKEITFSSIEIDPACLRLLDRLENVQTIGFYCCRNTDSAVPFLLQRKIDLLWFELGDLSPRSLQLLGKKQPMAEIAIEKELTKAEVEILRAFPSDVKISTSVPLRFYE